MHGNVELAMCQHTMHGNVELAIHGVMCYAVCMAAIGLVHYKCSMVIMSATLY